MTEVDVRVNFLRLLAEKEARENRRYTMADVARGTNMSRQALYAWINGSIRTFRMDTLVAICQFLECQPGDLLAFVPVDGEREEEREPA